MTERGKFLLALLAISLILGSISVKAQVNDKLIENSGSSQYKLKINLFEPNKTFSSDGIDKAGMCITLINKTSGDLEYANSDIEVLLKIGSQIGDLSTQEVKISQGSEKSEDFYLTSTQPGTAIVIANAVNFEDTNASITFEPTPAPSEIYVDAHPNKNILANDNASTILTVQLLKADGEPFKPNSDINIDLWTNDKSLEPITIFKDKFYGKTEFRTYKAGDVNITARSPEYNLSSTTMVNFVPAVTALTLFIAFIGGLLMGIAKHILPEQPNKKPEEADNQGNLAKKLKNALTSAEFYKYPCHGFFGIVVYLLFFFKVAYLDRLNIPTDVNWGIFVIGVIGGISFYPIMHGIEKVMGWK